MLLLGIIISCIIVLFAISGGDAGLGAIVLFINIPSAIIVVCPALALILAAYGGKGLGLVFKAPFSRNMIKENIKNSVNVYKDLKLYLIVWGWVGMLMGLILIGANLEDLEALGPGLALAMMTVLYGYILAYVICYPIQRRLEQSEVD